jgi:hypothetical protein
VLRLRWRELLFGEAELRVDRKLSVRTSEVSDVGHTVCAPSRELEQTHMERTPKYREYRPEPKAAGMLATALKRCATERHASLTTVQRESLLHGLGPFLLSPLQHRLAIFRKNPALPDETVQGVRVTSHVVVMTGVAFCNRLARVG